MKVLLTLGFVVGMVLFFVYASKKGEALAARKKGRLAAARLTEARVVATKQGTGAVVVNGRRGPEVVLTLEIEGRVVEEQWNVFELGLARVQPGARIPVRVDAQDPNVVYPAEDWAELTVTRWIAVVGV